MNKIIRKARLICKACTKHTNKISNITTNNINVNDKKALDDAKLNAISENYDKLIKKETPSETSKTNSKSNVTEIVNTDEYKFELISYGYVTDTIIVNDKEKAIRYYFNFNNSGDYAFKLYINNIHIPFKEIKNKLGITQSHQFSFYKGYI